VGRGLLYPSARVIALGRLLLAALFLVAIWIDVTQPAIAPAATYKLLAGYLAFAIAMVLLTWKDWWLDARLAGPGHAVDIVVFMVLVFLTEGYTSPFFIFFVFLLLAAAIRWGWRETALTAILVTFLYLLVGMVAVKSQGPLELYHFIIRTSQLVIISLVLIWFGSTQWRARSAMRDHDLLPEPSLDKSPFETGLAAAMADVGAVEGIALWRDGADKKASAIKVRDGDPIVRFKPPPPPPDVGTRPFLYDIGRGRALSRDAERNLCALDVKTAVGGKTIAALELSEGLGVPLELDGREAVLFLEGVPHLSTDHLDLGEQIGTEVSAHIQRHALLRAAEDSAEARSRLTLARDLHDSVVQFLAGAAIRLEAMKRSEASGRPLEPELKELKQLMLQEQGELRSFISALRGGPEIAFAELARDLQGLAERLAKQWKVQCSFAAENGELPVPARVRLDAHQLVREAVANAVRHAGAKVIRIALAEEGTNLRIELVNDGAEFPRYGDSIEPPQTLKERVDEAGGKIEVARGMDVTKVSIALPIRAGSMP
jgi:signal transduction histidine kinase